MNYRHIYHAGNFADVVKHIILIALINNLKKKEKPFAVLDAFAGIGLYDLTSERPNKTSEYSNGIGLLYDRPKENLPQLIVQYIDVIKDFNDSVSSIEYYPGSPMIIGSIIRDDDMLIASELHKEDFLELKRNMGVISVGRSSLRAIENGAAISVGLANMKLYPRNDEIASKVAIHNMDAYNAIKAFVPPKEKRGLVFIDPAFEVRDEFDKLITSLKQIKTSFLTGMVMIWFPIKDISAVARFYQKYREIGYKESLLLEFEISNGLSSGNKMNKFGILIANPPFIKDEITKAMDYLVSEIYQGKAGWRLINQK